MPPRRGAPHSNLPDLIAEPAAALSDDAARLRLLTEARDQFERMGAPLQVQRLDNLLLASRS